MQKRNPRLDIDPELLRRLFVEEMKSTHELMKVFQIGRATLAVTLDYYGIPRRKRGPRSPHHHGSWKGGKVLDKDGYILIHKPYGYVREHRLIMESHLGRALDPKEVVHHINKNKRDNRIENLLLYSSNGEHLQEELKNKCPKWSAAGRKKIALAIHKDRFHVSPHFDVSQLYNSGLTMRKIGKMVGCTPERIHKELVRLKVRLRKLTDLPRKKVRAMLKIHPTPVVAEKLGVKIGSLYAFLQKNGIPTSRKQGVPVR